MYTRKVKNLHVYLLLKGRNTFIQVLLRYAFYAFLRLTITTWVKVHIYHLIFLAAYGIELELLK